MGYRPVFYPSSGNIEEHKCAHASEYTRFIPKSIFAITHPTPESDAGCFISTSFNVGKNNSIKRLNIFTQRSAVKFQLNCPFVRIDIVINSADVLCCEL